MFKLNLQTNPTPEQQRWLDAQFEKARLVPVPKKENPCIAIFGKGPDEKRCKTCSHLVCFSRARNYYKCDLRKITHGAATDHLVNWPACAKYQPQ